MPVNLRSGRLVRYPSSLLRAVSAEEAPWILEEPFPRQLTHMLGKLVLAVGWELLGGQLARGLIPFAVGFFMGCLDPKSNSHPTDGKVETVRVSRLKFRSWHSGGLLVK